jgi:hypothetical protein
MFGLLDDYIEFSASNEARVFLKYLNVSPIYYFMYNNVNTIIHNVFFIAPLVADSDYDVSCVSFPNLPHAALVLV